MRQLISVLSASVIDLFKISNALNYVVVKVFYLSNIFYLRKKLYVSHIVGNGMRNCRLNAKNHEKDGTNPHFAPVPNVGKIAQRMQLLWANWGMLFDPRIV